PALAGGAADEDLPESVHLGLQLVQGAGVVDDVGGDGAALLAGRLAGHAGAGVLLGHAAPLRQAVEPRLLGGVHHHDLVVHGGQAVLHQQRDVVDDDRVGGG